MKKLAILIFIYCVQLQAGALPIKLQNLIQKMEGSNRELKYSEFNLKNEFESLKVSESFQYPTLYLSAGSTRSKAIDYSSTVASQGSSLTSSASSLGIQMPSTTYSTDGTTTTLGMSYYLFTRYAITQSISAAQTGIDSAQLNKEIQKFSKRSQLLQVLMEWQWLQSLISPLQTAMNLSETVKIHSQKNSNLLYTETERVDLSEKSTELKYNYIKAKELLRVAEAALFDLVPGAELSDFQTTPRYQIKYEIPPEEQLKELYATKSLKHRIQENDEKIAFENYQYSKWNKPWVPTALVSASYYNFLPSSSSTSQDGWSVGLLLNFTFFDGFYSSARNAQSELAWKLAKTKKEDMLSKHRVQLEFERSKALISKAEFDLKQIKAKRKKLQLEDVQDKLNKGFATRFEISAATLDYVKSQLEALDALKSYQASSLSIAIELNDWERVKIDETR